MLERKRSDGDDERRAVGIGRDRGTVHFCMDGMAMVFECLGGA